MTLEEALLSFYVDGPWDVDWKKYSEFTQNSAFCTFANTLRAARTFEEALDNVRASLELDTTHYLILPDQVRDVFAYVKNKAALGDTEAIQILTSLKEE